MGEWWFAKTGDEKVRWWTDGLIHVFECKGRGIECRIIGLIEAHLTDHFFVAAPPVDV